MKKHIFNNIKLNFNQLIYFETKIKKYCSKDYNGSLFVERNQLRKLPIRRDIF